MEKEKLIRLVQGAQSGDRKAFSDLFNAFQSTVYGIAMRETKKPETAADVLQETFIEVIQTIGKLQEPVAFVSWLKTIAYHQCTRYYRKKETKHETLVEEREDASALFDALEEENEEFIPDKALENEELCETIRMFVEGLPNAQRAAIMMKYFDELSVKEIAAIQGVSENTVLSRLYYGRNAIKAEVETYEKKHNIKLHAIPLLPLLGNVFSNTNQAISVKTSVAAAKAIASATGVKVTVAGAGVAGAMATSPLVIKIGAGVVAVAASAAIVATGIGIAKQQNATEWKDSATSSIAQNVSEEIAPLTEEEVETIFLGAKNFYDINIYGRGYIEEYASMYTLDSFSWIDDIIEYEGRFYEFCDRYTYDEYKQALSSHFTTNAVTGLVEYVGLLEQNGKCYTHIREGVGDPVLAYEIRSVERAEEKAYTIHIDYTTMGQENKTHKMYCVYENGNWVIEGFDFYPN